MKSEPHKPDESMLSKSVTGWRPVSKDSLFSDGDTLLLALPVYRGEDNQLRYIYTTVSVDAGDDYCDFLDSEGEEWDGRILDADFYVVLR